MTRFENKSLNQILLQIVGPLLIALMVGSLVCFLIEVFYRGPHTARLYWVMSLFTIASVLVSRISIEEGRERAQLFGVALGLATLVTSLNLVKFSYGASTIAGPLVIVALIATVMWTAAKLTWDCTVIDNSRDASSMGLIEKIRRRASAKRPEQETTSDTDPAKQSRGRFSFLSGGKKNSPGLWVFYFAVFALPVFGFGQWLVQRSSQRWIFVLFAVYLGASLGLLMITSLLGLERYLARRNLHVPNPVARNWVLVGSIFILLAVLGVMFIPKPAGSSSIENLFAFLNSPTKESSSVAPGKDGQRHEDQAKKQNADVEAGRQQPDGDAGDNEIRDGGDKENNSVETKESERNESKQNTRSNNENQNGDSREKPAPKSDVENQPRQPPKARENNEPGNDRNDERNANGNREQENAARKEDRSEKPQPRAANRNQPSETVSRIFESASKAIRTIIYLVGIVAAVVLVWLFRQEIARLFARREKKSSSPASETSPPEPKSLPPFGSFKDPFASGHAKSMTAKQLAQYTMSALDALSRDLDLARESDETPSEFARRLSAIDKELSVHAMELADLYGRCAFAREAVSREDMRPLVGLWRLMRKIYSGSPRVESVTTTAIDQTS